MHQLDILLTVPHGADGNDRSAPAVARSLHEKLQTRGYRSRLLISRCCRYERADMNRDEGRASKFRKVIAKSVRVEKPKLLLDIHSYPADVARFDWQDIVLLESCQDGEWLRRYARLLAEPGLARVSVSPSEWPNDLCEQAVELGHPRSALMLVEHHDDGDADLFAHLHALAIGQVLANGLHNA